TRPYMAPEQWVGKHQNEQTDQYALAVTFYELISGAVPFASIFETGDTILMMNVIETKSPESLPGLKRKQNKFLLTALAKDPKKRFSSCSDFVNAVSGGKITTKNTKSTKKGPMGKIILLILFLVLGYFGYDTYQKNEQRKAEQIQGTEQARLESERKAREQARLELDLELE
ncbi:MAG: hypothetical protein U9O87_03260, partial [Verrucomicrobiota bacterium]|nr:hypothetical protein [Verrucomicrobiota bacterium]